MPGLAPQVNYYYRYLCRRELFFCKKKHSFSSQTPLTRSQQNRKCFQLHGDGCCRNVDPALPGGTAQPPWQSPSSISFRSFSGEPGSPPRARLSYSLASPGRWPLSGFSSRPLGHVGPAAAGRPESAARPLHAPAFLFASAGRSCVPKPGFPRGLTR